MKDNSTPDICSKCGGQCCKKMPGAVFPEDLGEVTVESIIDRLKNGYQFDWWDGDPRLKLDPPVIIENPIEKAYFMRPATIESRGQLLDPSWGGVCAFLTPTGCPMKFKDRPTGCKALVAAADFRCKSTFKYSDKLEACIRWLPYTELVKEAVRSLGGSI